VLVFLGGQSWNSLSPLVLDGIQAILLQGRVGLTSSGRGEERMSGATSVTEQQQQAMQAALAMAQIPQIVFNGFANSYTASEFSSVLTFGNRPVIALTMPPAVAKSFALGLLESVERYEAATGETVHTVAELSERIAKYQSEHSA
jgi:protoheme ferro-lyase